MSPSGPMFLSLEVRVEVGRLPGEGALATRATGPTSLNSVEAIVCDVTETAVDVGRVLQHLAHLGERIGDRRIGELDVVGDPLVVDVRTGRPEDVLLQPVGDLPAGGLTGADADAPRLLAAGGICSVSAISSSQVVGTV